MIATLFEDSHLLAISKPSGLPSQSHGTPGEVTAESLIAEARPELKLHLLHRLDTGTSGVLLFAKSESVFDEIRLKFKQREIEKHYVAWCAPSPALGRTPHSRDLPLLLDLPLAHHPKSKKRMIALPAGLNRNYRGKPIQAISLIHKIAGIKINGSPGFEVSIQIKTGVMHQIRVHLSHMGMPILGDPLYGKDLPPFPRLALHARSISFQCQGHRYQIESKLTQFL